GVALHAEVGRPGISRRAGAGPPGDVDLRGYGGADPARRLPSGLEPRGRRGHRLAYGAGGPSRPGTDRIHGPCRGLPAARADNGHARARPAGAEPGQTLGFWRWPQKKRVSYPLPRAGNRKLTLSRHTRPCCPPYGVAEGGWFKASGLRG